MKFQELLQETPLPPDWIEAIFDPSVPFEARVAYAKRKAAELGAGSSRVVFSVPYRGRDTALKVATNNAGVGQNRAETRFIPSIGRSKHSRFVIPYVDHDRNGFTWVQTEQGKPMTAADYGKFERALGFDIRQLILDIRNYGEPFATKDPITREGAKNGFDFIDMLEDNPEIMAGDLVRIENWVWYKGRPVIADIGLDAQTFDMYYSKRARRLSVARV